MACPGGLMTAVLRRRLVQANRPTGALTIAKRGLGDTVRGPAVTDFAANLKIATQFFSKGSISYAEYKQQCVSLRLFVFAAVSVGCVGKLVYSPPKSSYWATYGPGGWLYWIKDSFSNNSPSLFLTKKSTSTDVQDALTSSLGGKPAPKKAAAAPEKAAAPPAPSKKAAPPAPAKKAEPPAPAPAAEAPKNAAFVFVKPHAVTPAANQLVREGLEARGCTILSEGDLTSEEIDEKKLIDQHYYAIASKATILKPKELNVPKDKFKAKFGLEWDDALAQGVVFNALDACKEFDVDAETLAKGWGDTKKNDTLIKFGGGFYCGLMKIKDKELYVFNGFFMSMRSAFTQPGRSIHYYTVEWDQDKLSWEDFRGKVLGPTDPADAPKDSLRGKMFEDWEALGLPGKPNTGDNGVHASASPFEAVAERLNWLGVQCKADSYCKALVDAGVKEETIKTWSVDPQVMDTTGKKGSLFDALEDMDATPCIVKCKMLQDSAL